MQGRWAEAYPATLVRIARDGHLVGNHSFYHARMPLLTRGGLVADVRASERVIEAIAGVSPRPWFRCPFGSGARHPLIVGRLAALGYRHIGWDVDSRDWANPSASRLASRVERLTIARGDGAIVLMHGWPEATLDALPAVIGHLADAGATFVRLDAFPVEEAAIANGDAEARLARRRDRADEEGEGAEEAEEAEEADEAENAEETHFTLGRGRGTPVGIGGPE